MLSYHLSISHQSFSLAVLLNECGSLGKLYVWECFIVQGRHWQESLLAAPVVSQMNSVGLHVTIHRFCACSDVQIWRTEDNYCLLMVGLAFVCL